MTTTIHGPTRRQALLMLSAAGAITVMPAGFGRAFAQEAPKGQVTIGFSQEPTVFNPHMLHIEVDEGIHFAVYDALWDILPDGSFQPMLATEVPTLENGGISADGLNWKVKLREGVTFHDGKPFTAEDVKFNIELLVNPDFKSWRRTGHELVRDLTVVSPTELTWRMEKPFAPYASILASTFIVPKHAFDGQDPNTAAFNNAPIGTGAFKWGERVAGDHITLEANPAYWGDGPYLERAIVKYIPDTTVLYTQFKSGDIDVVGLQWISPEHLEEAKTLAGRKVALIGNGFFESVSLNMSKPYFQDLKVRQALYHAIDKGAIIDALYYGTQLPTETFMPAESTYYNADLPQHEFSLEKANALLDEAGWTRGAGGVREKDGTRLAFKISTTAGNHLREQAQQFIQQTWKEIGVELEISNLPPAVMWGDYWMLSQFDSVIVGLNVLAGADPDCSDFFRSTSSAAKGGAGQNTWVYQSPEVDALLEAGATTFDPAKRKEAYLKLQEVIRADLPFLPIFQYRVIPGWKDTVEGLTGNVNNRIGTWNLRSWKVTG